MGFLVLFMQEGPLLPFSFVMMVVTVVVFSSGHEYGLTGVAIRTGRAVLFPLTRSIGVWGLAWWPDAAALLDRKLSSLSDVRSRSLFPLGIEQLHNKMEDLKGKIRVYVRVRPFSTKEKARGCMEAVSGQGKTTIAVQDPRVKEEKTFDFDQVNC